LLHASSGLLQDDPFNVISDTGSHVPFSSPSTRQSNFVLVSTKPLTFASTSSSIYVSIGSSSSSIETLSYFDRHVVMNNRSPISHLLRWVIVGAQL
jgi:hypothetical protein